MSNTSHRRVVAVYLALAAAWCLGAAGCGGRDSGGNPARVRVTGKVTLDNQPAPAGTIVFIPLQPGQLQAQGLIGDDGTFVIDEANGPSAGDYKVEIQCAKKTGRRIQSLQSTDGTGMIDERIPVIPKQYNIATTLRQTIVDGKNDLAFNLTSTLHTTKP